MSSALKLLRLLDLIGAYEAPVRVADLAREMGSTRSETHRQLVTLVAAGWLDRLPDGTYQLTVKAAHLGQAALQQAGFGDRVSSVLLRLAEDTGQSACLAVLDDDATRVIKRAEPGTAAHVTMALGRRLSLLNGATGRVLLAFAPPSTVEGLRQRGVEVPTDEQLAEIRGDGYATIPSGDSDGLAGIAVPVQGRTEYPSVALCAVGPAAAFDPLSAQHALRATARELGRIATSVGTSDAVWEA